MGKKTQESIHHLVGKNNMIHVFSPYDFFTKHYLTKTFMEKIYCRHDLWGVGVEYPIDLMKLKALKTSSLLMQPKDQSDDFINLSLFQKFKNSCKKGYRSIYNHLNFKEKIQNLFKNTFDFICEHHFVGTEPHSSFEMPENTGWWPINGEI
jgi:hypothetical protein